MRILVVDDETVSLRKMEMIMKYYGECHLARDGESAIAAFVRAWEDWYPFDLITLDMVMPNMNGDVVLDKIRGLEKEKKVPEDRRVKIIMVTGQSDSDTVLACIQRGCNEFVAKPFDRAIVQAKIAHLYPQLDVS